MKRYFSIGVLVALAALLLGACSKDVKEELVGEQIGPRTVSFNVSMADQTRTGLAFKFVPYWTETDVYNVHLFETYQGVVIEGHDVQMDIDEDRHNEVAHFQADFTEETVIIVNPPSSTGYLATRADSKEYTYTGIFAQKEDGKFIIPSVQKPDATLLIDPNADFLIGDAKKGFSKSQTSKDVDLFFVRPVAVSRLAIMNVTAGTKIKSVKITSSDKLTGAVSYENIDFTNGEVPFDTESGATTIELNYGTGVDIPGEATFYAYFVSLAGTKNITSIEVTTDTHTYVKEVSKALTFKTDDFKNIAVDMSKVTPTAIDPDQPQDQDIKFMKDNGKITADSFVLGSGDYVTPTLEGAEEGATVSWEVTSSDPEGVASVAKVEDVWIVTPAAAGVATITATASAVEGFKETSVSYTLTVTEAEPVDQELKFVKGEGQDQQEFDEENGDTFDLYPAGGEYTAPTLTGVAEGATVTYSIACTPEGVATINETTGAVTPAAVGTAIITATASAVTGYNAATKSYKLTVSDSTPTVTPHYYAKVTAQSEVVEGGKYIIVNEGDSPVIFKPVLTTAKTNYLRTTDNALSTDIMGGSWIAADAEGNVDACMIVLERKSDNKDQYDIYAPGVSTETEKYYFVPYMDYNGTGNDLTFYAVKGTQGDCRPTFTVTSGVLSLVRSSNYKFYFDGNKFDVTTGTVSNSKLALYKYVEGENPADVAQTLSFSPTSYSVAVNATTINEPELSGAFTTVTYESSDSGVAEVDENTGALTLKAVGGPITITATAAKEKGYAAGSATYELTVTEAVAAKTFTKVTSNDDVEEDAQYILVYESANKAFKPILATSGTVFTKSTDNALDVVINTTDHTIVSADLDDCLITFEEGKYLWIESASKYLYPGESGDNALGAEAKTTSHSVSITVNSNGIATIGRSNDTKYHLYWSSSKYFSGINQGNTQTSSSSYDANICIYKLDDGRQMPTMSFSPKTAEIDLASVSSFTKPALTYTGDATSITYTSSDTAVAEVSNDGTITPKKKGTVTITAKAARTATYKAASASYELTVTNSNAQSVTYYKASMLETGYDYLIVSSNQALKNSGNGNVVSAEAVVVNNNTIVLDDADDLLWTVADAEASLSDNGKYTLKNETEYLYRNGGSGTSTLIASTERATPKYSVWNYVDGYLYNISTSTYGTSTYYAYYSSGWVITTTETAASIYTARPVRDLSFSVTSAEFDMAEPTSFVKPTLNGASGATVTYASSNTDYATVSADGTITAVKKTSTPITITATVAGDSQYQTTSVSYQLTIVNSNQTTQYYTKVSSNSGLPTTTDAASGNYLIVYEDGDKAYVFKPICSDTPTGGGTDSSGHPELTKSGSAIEMALTTDGIAATSAIEGCEIQMKKKDGSSSWYLYSPGIGWWLRINSSAGTLVAMKSAGYGCSFSFSGTNNNMILSRKDGNSTAYMRYSASNTYFEATTNSSTSHSLSLYKLSE